MQVAECEIVAFELWSIVRQYSSFTVFNKNVALN